MAITPAGAAEPLAYTLREAGVIVGVDQLAPLDGLATCDGSIPSFRYSAGADRLSEWMVAGGTHRLTLVARDLAGNESPPVPVMLGAECREADAGVSSVADAGHGETPAPTTPAVAAGSARARCAPRGADSSPCSGWSASPRAGAAASAERQLSRRTSASIPSARP